MSFAIPNDMQEKIDDKKMNDFYIDSQTNQVSCEERRKMKEKRGWKWERWKEIKNLVLPLIGSNKEAARSNVSVWWQLVHSNQFFPFFCNKQHIHTNTHTHMQTSEHFFFF